MRTGIYRTGRQQGPAIKKLIEYGILSKSVRGMPSKRYFTFNIKGLDSSMVANVLNEKYKIAVRAGMHCSPLIHKKLGTEKLGAVRVSLDYNNEFYEIDFLIKALNVPAFV